MKGFIFNLQRFATTSIKVNESTTIDGVTYKAVEDTQLNIDDDNKVSGIASGKIQATVANAEDSPTLTLDASDGAFNFTATSDGKVISITPFPIEFISGEFTYNGNRIDITAGSDLAIATKRGDFVLRNENHFVTDSAYIFTTTSLTSDSKHVISDFSLTNGDDVRELHLEQLGTVINHFDQLGATLVKGSSEVLNIGNYKLTATAKDKDAGLNFELGEAGMTFVPNTGDGTLTVALSRNGNEIISGELECTNGTITFGYDHAVTFTEGTSFNFTWNNYVSTVTATGDATTAIALTDNGITFTPGENDGGLALVLTKDSKTVFGGTLNITDGSITFNSDEKKFSFTEGTKIALGIGTDGKQAMDFEIVGGDASFKMEANSDGSFTITPDKNDGSLSIALKQNGKTVFKNTVTVNGAMIINPETDLLTLKDGTTVSLAFDNYTMTATASGDAASKVSLTEEGISITPQTDDDGKLKLTLGTKTGSGSMSVDVEVLSGGFLFGTDGALTVTEGTELQLTFSDDYIVNFKATDAAGGAISIGTDGITFAPNSDEKDGGLQLTVKRGDDTRSASLDVTGSLTYKLDGSISLTKGTVVKNVFDDGNILTITALTDASGSIIFSPQDGVTITPAEEDALNVLLTGGGGKVDVFNITSIKGSVNYKGGIVTASKDTEVLFTNYYMENEMKLRTEGGSSSLEITEDSTSYIANEGATFTLDYQDGTILKITEGKFIDDYEHAIITAGSTFKTNDDEDYFYLQTAGNYTLNGMKVTTTEDNVQVVLSDYKTITVDGISYTPLDEDVTLTIGENITTCAGGKVTMQMNGFNKSLTFDTTDGSISYDSSSNAYLISTADDLAALAQRVNGGDDCTGLTFKLTNDIDMSSIANFTPIGNYTSQSDYNAFNGTFDGGGYTISNLTINHPNDTNQALFGNVDYGATIQNLNIVNAKVTGYKDVGGVVGWHGGNLVNCTVSNSTITSTQEDVGGIAGDNEGAVNSCRAINTTVNGKYSVGGLVGDNDGMLGNSYVISPTVTTVSSDVAGARLGAVAGDNSGTVEAHCYDIGSLARIGKNTGTDSGKEITDLTEIPGDPENVQLPKGKFTVTADTSVIITQNEQIITLTATEETSATYKIEGGIYYFNLGSDAAANVSVTGDGEKVFSGGLEIGGVFSYNPDTGTFGMTGANSSHGSGTNSFVELTTANGYGFKMATNDTTVVFVPKFSDGKFEVEFPNERKNEMLFAFSKDGNTTFEGQVTINGTIGFDVAKQELSLTKDTVLTLRGDGENDLEVKALDDAGGQLTFTDEGIRFAPNAGDGALELNFVSADRKVNIDISSGAIIFGGAGKISLVDGTEINLDWEDGTNIRLNSHGSTGSIGFGKKGIQITADDENLDMTLTTPDGYSTTITSIQGAVWYNAGTVTLDANTYMTGKNIVEGHAIGIKVEAQGGEASLHFANNGFTYSTGEGKTRVTYTLGDAESSFTLNKGSVFIQGRVFHIAEGSDLATDFKDFISAQYFQTQEAGDYTINGQTIKTSAPNLALTATDNYMSFATSDDLVIYDEMTFAGAGTVSLTSGGVILGAGVEATGFGEGKSFILAEAGNVTVDARIFELTKIEGTPREIPMIITVTGAQDGFIFSRTLTKESEAYLDDALDEEAFANYSSPYIGKIFTEKFIAANDNSYRIRTDAIGLEEVIGISDGATVTGGAILDNEPTLSYFNLVTDTEGAFTIGERTYNIGGDSSVAIRARFEVDTAPYASYFDSLSGTVSGDFTEHPVSINGSSSAVQAFGDTDVSIVADDSGFEIFGLDEGASLKVSAKDTYIVNNTTINANGGDYIMGLNGNAAGLYGVNNDTLVSGTEHNDTINNVGEGVTIQALAGDDSISNIGDNVSISGGTGNDTIYNHGDDITIDAGLGNNSISNNSDNVVFIWSGGDDTITGFKEDSVLSLGSDYSTQESGDDVIVSVDDYKIVLKGASTLDNVDIMNTGVTINNVNSDSLISGTKINDSISNYGTNVTIQALGGDDTIYNESENSIIDAGTGNDSISNYSPQGVLLSDNVSINAGAGNDTILNEHAYNVTLEGGAGNDKIIVVTGNQTYIDGGEGNDSILGETLESESSTWAMGGYATIDGGSGDDYINPILSDSASIMGGAGNDTIINEGDDTTINGGAGDDIISLHGASLESNVIKYEAGEGNDSIFGFNETSKLSITAGTEYSTVISGDDVLVSVGSNTITIASGADLSTVNIVNYDVPALNINNTVNNTLITGTELADTIQNSGEEVKIAGVAGNDSIISSGANGSLNGGAGNDTIQNSGDNATIEGYYGDDRLTNSGSNVLVRGNYGNDTIINSGDNVTLSGGSGYNYASNTGDNVMFNFGGGLDTIYGFNETSSLSVSSADYETLYAGKDILVSVGDDVAILKNAFLTNDSLNINGTPIEVDDKVIYLMPGGDEATIGRSNVSIVSGDGDDRISLTSDATNDVIQYASGDGNDTIWGFNDTSKISISGSYSAVKVGDNVIFKVGNNSITAVDASNLINEEIVLTEKDTTTLDGKVFELTENVPSGVTIKSTDDGFTVGITKDDGKIFTDEFIAQGDDDYTVQIDSKGLQTVSGIDAGTEITTGATEDGEEAENQIYIVTKDAGSYTFNDMNFTAGKANAVIRLRPYAMAFDAADGILYDGKTFSGSGNVTVSAEAFALGANVFADGVKDGESFILMQKGSATVDGRTFELTEDIPEGITIASAGNDYTFSHVITQKEATRNNAPDSYIGQTFSENVIVAGDETYSLQADSFGLKKVRGISDGATVNGGDTSIDGDYNDKYAKNGQNFSVETDTEGTFTIGDKAYSISGDNNVEIKAMFLPEKSYASGFASLDGTVSSDFDGDAFYVNSSRKPILINGDDSVKVVGSTSGTKLLDVSDGASLSSLGGVREVHTDTEGAFWLAADPVPFGVTVTGDDNVTFGFDNKGDLMTVDNLEGNIEFSKGTGGKLSINGIGIHTGGIDFSSIGAYDNSLYIHDIERGTITAYEPEKVWLQMTGETMTLNGNELTLTADSDGIWLRDKEIVGLDEGASLKVSAAGTYTANTTELKAKAGDVIIGLEDNDAYIYDENNPLITRKTPNAEIIKIFEPKNYTIARGEQNITLEGGDLAIVENTSAQVDITAGDDTIVSQGENVHVSLTPEKNTWLFPLGGKMTLEGYDESTGTGFGTTFADILSAVEDGRINFNNGNLWIGSAQVTMDKNSELMNFFDRVGKQQKVGYASQSDSLDVSNETDDLLLVAKKNGIIKSGTGNDTILANGGNFIDSGAGHDLVKMTGEGNSNIVLNERTTVEGFHTGFGDGSDTVYINVEGDPAVDFKANGLTFYDGGDIMTLSDVGDTAKVNLYYEGLNRLRRSVFIGRHDWYQVEDSDLADDTGAGVNTELGIYFVGTSATKNHGIDFSGVKKDLNISMNTDYNSTTAEFWVNNIHSVKGGAGNTTIVGSDKSDTILAGTGEQSIYGGAGHDKLFGNTDADKNVATFFYTPGDGRDSIENFDFMTDAQDVTADKVQIDDNSAITDVFLRGDDVGIRIDGGKEFLMLEGAQGKSFRLNDDLIAKVDTNVEFDGYTNYYVGIGAKASLTVGKGAGNVEVWLSDDSLEYHGTMYDGNFTVLDASQADGSNILAGNELNNVIIGGSGENSLWGGYSSENDTLIGGTGQNTFFYGSGNGNDKIQNAHNGDIISLEDISLDQISDANITTGGVIFKFTDGGSLTVDGTADVTYQLSDGSKFSANHERMEWEDK